MASVSSANGGSPSTRDSTTESHHSSERIGLSVTVPSCSSSSSAEADADARNTDAGRSQNRTGTSWRSAQVSA